VGNSNISRIKYPASSTGAIKTTVLLIQNMKEKKYL
jgi:hypothetical protein